MWVCVFQQRELSKHPKFFQAAWKIINRESSTFSWSCRVSFVLHLTVLKLFWPCQANRPSRKMPQFKGIILRMLDKNFPRDAIQCNFSEGQMGQGALSGPRPGRQRVSIALQGAVVCTHRRRAAQVTFYTFWCQSLKCTLRLRCLNTVWGIMLW